ncbi:protein-tyrosine-phosphatase [Clostridium sp. ASBs410]|nr:protein-tyrosine-phosphatase [Clostridium sp. ASBs410]
MTNQYQNTINLLFVCHGNICRSPMAEFVMKNMIEKEHLGNRFYVASAATSTEEIGNPVHRGTKEKLREYGISSDGKYAVQLSRKDYDKYDYLIGMEQRNVTNMLRILGGDPEGKVKRLLDYSPCPRDIADPWYTGDFDRTYDDVYEGCKALLTFILEQETEGKYR